MDFDFFKSVILPYTNFAIFLFLLVKFARKPLAQLLTSRKEAFLESSRKAKELHEQTKIMNTQLQSRLDNLNTELNDISNTVIKTAEAEAQKIISDAERLAEAVKNDARQMVQSEIAQAEQDLHQELVKQAAAEVKAKLKSGLAKEASSAMVTSGINKIRTMNL